MELRRTRRRMPPAAREADLIDCAWSLVKLSPCALMDICGRKEISYLSLGRGWSVRPMHHIFVNGFGKIRADGARCRVLRIGGAHHLAVHAYGVFSFQYLYYHRSRNHEFNQVLKKGPIFMHCVETLRLLAI